MKLVKLLSVFFLSVLVFSACQKELSFENSTAVGSLKYNSSGDCMPVTVNGIYKKDTLLNSTNYIDVQLNITTTGTYDIRTDTVNGYSFRGVGAAGITGLNTVRLLGTGKPLTAGTNIFKVRFDTSVCEVNIDVTTGTAPTGAVYTIDCSGATPAGNYQIGTAMTASNTVTVMATPTALGAYTITTNSPNGVSFSKSGTFSGPVGTPVSVTLNATGTPTGTAGPVVYTATATGGTSNCSFTVNYTAAGPAATYTINCAGATVAGTYQQGTPMTAGNTVTISATSTGAGSYSISAAANGVTFSGSGTFPSATTQTVMLTASGTPVAAGSFPFTATAATGGSTCTFNITFTPGTAPATDFINATIDGVAKTFTLNGIAIIDNTSVPGYTAITLEANNAALEDMFLAIALQGTTTPPAGTYTVNQAPAKFAYGDYYDNNDDFVAQPDGTTQSPAFSIVVTSVTATRINGTFSGPMKANNGAGPGIVTVTNGSFSLPF